jgi:NOL1/NOP2/fmu family ribosome biogenesis protein
MVSRGKREANAFDPKQVEHSVSRQRRILLAACRLLKPGGRLIYSTCTFAVEENEAQMRFLRDRFPNCFEPIVAARLEPWVSPIEPGCYRLWPHRDPTSGAFAAGLRMTSPVAGFPSSSKTSSSKRGAANALRASRDRHRFEGSKVISEFGQLHQIQICESERGDACGIPTDVPKEIGGLIAARELPTLATCRNGVWKPHFSLAMLDATWFTPHRTIEISDDKAMKYLRGEALCLETPEPCKPPSTEGIDTSVTRNVPWGVVQSQQKPMGWGKFAGTRLNNHLPPQAILAVGSNGDLEEFRS